MWLSIDAAVVAGIGDKRASGDTETTAETVPECDAMLRAYPKIIASDCGAGRPLVLCLSGQFYLRADGRIADPAHRRILRR